MLEAEDAEDEDTWNEAEDSLAMFASIPQLLVLIIRGMHLITVIEKARHRANLDVTPFNAASSFLIHGHRSEAVATRRDFGFQRLVSGRIHWKVVEGYLYRKVPETLRR